MTTRSECGERPRRRAERSQRAGAAVVALVFLPFGAGGATEVRIPQRKRLKQSGIEPSPANLYLIAVFPANGQAAWLEIKLGNYRTTPLWLRAPIQLLFIAVAL